MTRTPALLAVVALVALLPAPAAVAAGGAGTAGPSYANCTALQQTYPHGIGRADAVDRVSGSSRPVTTFRRDTRGYLKAIAANRGLDRDRDGVACEKR